MGCSCFPFGGCDDMGCFSFSFGGCIDVGCSPLSFGGCDDTAGADMSKACNVEAGSVLDEMSDRCID